MPILRGRRSHAFSRRKAPTKVEPGSVVPDLSIWEQYRRIGGTLSPVELSNIIRAADGGSIESLCDVANDARQKDCHLQSVLFTRESALAGLDWQLEIPGVKPNAKRPRGAVQARFCEEALRGSDELESLIAHLAGAVFWGHATAEIIWTKRKDGKVVPKYFKRLAQRRFAFRDTDSKLVLRQTKGELKEIDFREVWPEKFLVAQPRITGDVPSREGLLRVLMWAALFRNWDFSDWLKLAELAWKPWRLGKYQKGASKEDIAVLRRIMAGMSSSGVAVYPETTAVELRWPDSTGGATGRSDHSNLFDTLGREMSKAVLGQTLTTEQGKVGSQALGNVHNAIRGDILEFDARFVAAVITRDLIKPLVRMNFGDSAIVPRFKFLTEEAVDLLPFAQGVGALAKVGMRIPASWVRDRVGMQEPDDEDEIIGGAPEPTDETKPGKDDNADGAPAKDEEQD